MRLVKVWFALLVLSCGGLASSAVAVELWQKGVHYHELPKPVATRDPKKIELVKLFWYGCPHCYDFYNQHMLALEKGLGADVDFYMMPATFPGWTVHAEAFYAAEVLGVLDKLHKPLFDRIVINPKAYKDVSDFKPIFVDNGVSAADYEKVFKASGFRKISRVQELVQLADSRIKDYRVTGVPALIVDGRYRIGVREAGSMENMVRIAHFLIDKERRAKSTASQ